MTWVTWRQYRLQAALALALFAALGVVLLISGLHAALVWHSAVAQCTKDNNCASVGDGVSLGNPFFGVLVVATTAVPLLPGLFWGAPMVAQELESGTHQFAWTQSITRNRWLAVRAGWLLLGAAVLAGAVSAVVTWWSGPANALNGNGFAVNNFDVTYIVPAGYAIFAVALGICAGTLLRRSIPALAVTLAVFVGVRMYIARWLRLHYMTPVSLYFKLTPNNVTQKGWPSGAYLGVSQNMVAANHQPIPPVANVVGWFNGSPIPAVCNAAANNPKPDALVSCMSRQGYLLSVTYQPAGRFWAFQGIETGIYVGLAAILLGVAFWVIKRRDA
jgi:hypothetical protein